MFNSGFLQAPRHDDAIVKATPVEQEILLSTQNIIQRIDRMRKTAPSSIAKANQLLGEAKAHLALRQKLTTYIGLDRHYHLLTASTRDFAVFIAQSDDLK